MSFRVLTGISVVGVAALCSIPILAAGGGLGPLSPATLDEIARVEAEIDRIEADTLNRLTSVTDNQVQQIELIGKLILFDKELSVKRNEACAFCHMPETGFSGPISELNRTTGSYPGSVRTRFSNRAPQTHSYAPLAPVLHYNEGQGDLVGGNFWDMRATGRRLGNPAAEQAEGPPPSIRRRWACLILHALSIAPRNDPIADCSKPCGVRKHSRSTGQPMSNRSVTLPVRLLPMIRRPCI
jgi:hypothetical protein